MIRHIQDKFNVRPLFLAAVILACCVWGCQSVPDEVIEPDKMVDLLADVYIGDAMIHNEYAGLSNDSNRLKLRQSVLNKYGVTSADLDTSMGWYGRHLELYTEIQDRVIERLENFQTEIAGVVSAAGMSQSGDSVDVWPGMPYLRLAPSSDKKYVTFYLEADKNWENGDSYTWRGKAFNIPGNSFMQVGVLYDDGAMDFANMSLSINNWQEVKIPTDSTRNAVKIFGSISISPHADAPVWIDSIMLVRKRVDHINPVTNYQQRKIYTYEGKKRLFSHDEDLTDSISVDNER